MATVTIGRAYFDVLLQKARLYTSGCEYELAPDVLSNVTVSRADYDHLQQCSQEYARLKSALIGGGLTMDVLNTLLVGESEAKDHNNAQRGPSSRETTLGHVSVPSIPLSYRSNAPSAQRSYNNYSTPTSDDTETVSDHLDLARPRPLHRTYSNNQTGSCIDDCIEEQRDYRPDVGRCDQIPTHDQRTILISNVAERTTHKDIAGIIRGGRLLDIFFRSDRSVTVSFVEGAADFLAYVQRNDTYLHAKRLNFRWADRQFKVPPRVAHKIAGGSSRNLIVRGVAGRVTEEQIRDHLDHIHNLVILDVCFKHRDAHVSINSIHNALSARACMMSRTIYKGTRIDWGLDECAAPLPRPGMKARPSVMRIPAMPLPVTNKYAVLDTDSEIDSDSHSETCKPTDIRIKHGGWTNAAVA